MKLSIGLFISALVTTVVAQCGPGYGSCPSNYCCSQYGYCGTTDAYCGKGCQVGFGSCYSTSNPTTTNPSSSRPTSTNGRCGEDFGICPNNDCCSQYGYCGNSSAHCNINEGCQSEFGRCNGSSSSNPTTTTTTIRTITKTQTSSSKPTSTNGRCGPSNGNTYCPDNQCCSTYGYCGITEEYCNINSGCQSEFGRCGNGGGYVSEGKFKFYNNCKNPKHWALTYDDGPYNYDLDLLDLLKKKGVKATFFINGANVMDITSSTGKEIVQRMFNDGHVIGSHTWSHADLSTLNEEGITYQMKTLEGIIYEYTGKIPAFMRPPYGAGNNDSRIGNILEKLGYTAAVMWNVDTLDWSTKGDISYARSVFNQNFGNPLLSLNHCFYQGISKESLLNLAEAEIDYVLSNGYTPVTMDVCLGLDAYQN